MEKHILTLTELNGQKVCCTPLNKDRHLDDLYTALGGKENADLWVYRFENPFVDKKQFSDYLDSLTPTAEAAFYVIIVGGEALGLIGLINNSADHKRIEVGSICLGKKLQRSYAATEAYYLIFTYIFEQLNYRRLEWKCDAANKASINAALRLGFSYEGLFRNHLLYKGRNRDTWWSSMIDSDWPNVKESFIGWLSPNNFSNDAMQLQSLQNFRNQ
ncbi:MAG: GNAT family N-acetyltransferase [Alphaproteobacteria bacterium]